MRTTQAFQPSHQPRQPIYRDIGGKLVRRDCAIPQVKSSTVLDWTRKGELPGFKLGRFRRYSRRQVEDHLANKAAESVNSYR